METQVLVGILVPGPYTAPVIFWNDIKRTDEQKGFFGEVNVDLSDTMELTLGARWYDIAVDLEGSANSSFYNFNALLNRHVVVLTYQLNMLQVILTVIQIKLKLMVL